MKLECSFAHDLPHDITQDTNRPRIICVRTVRGVKSIELYRNLIRYLVQREREYTDNWIRPYGARTRRDAVFLRKRHRTTTRGFALSVERLLRVTGQFRRSSLQLHARREEKNEELAAS